MDLALEQGLRRRLARGIHYRKWIDLLSLPETSARHLDSWPFFLGIRIESGLDRLADFLSLALVYMEEHANNAPLGYHH